MLPVPKNVDTNKHAGKYLYAANNTPIKTFGTKRITVNLGLRRDFTWIFKIADVNQTIIGRDFLSHFDLLVDSRRQRLIDNITGLHTIGKAITHRHISINSVSSAHPFAHILNEFKDVLELNIDKPSKTNAIHCIETSGPATFARARRLSPEKLAAAKAEFSYLVKKGICRPSKSSWSSPLHMVKKSDGSWRPCGDYRSLNAITVPDRYPLPYLHDCTSILDGTQVYSIIDLRKAYHQIPINPADIDKTAIITPFGLFEFTMMCFGLRNAAQTMQRHINAALSDLPFAFAYIDDILIASKTHTEHEQHIRTVLQRLREHSLSINLEKCQFGQEELKFLGHLVTKEGIKPLPAKVEAILAIPRPEIAKNLKGFISTINFYRRFLPKAVEQQQKLYTLIDGNIKNDKRPINWTEETINAFEECKRQLANAATLAHPRENAPLALMVDASDTCVGAVLHQLYGNAWQPLGFYSKKLMPAQTRYSAYDRELTAIYQGVLHFKYMLEARPFCIYTDHKPLTFAFKQNPDKASPRQARQLDTISQFTTDVRHVPGKDNTTADLLSRVSSITSPLDMDALAKSQMADEELKEFLAQPKDNQTQLKRLTIPDSTDAVYCDVSTGVIRPFVTKAFRRAAVAQLHDICHPGIRTTTKLVRDRFVWPRMATDVKNVVRACEKCQRSKVTRHSKTPFSQYDLDSARFERIHIDIIGPLPPSNGFKYCLSMIDRFTRWPEVTPLNEITAQTVARALVETWISRFGVPLTIITDQGRQFESSLFNELCQLLNIKHWRASPYHPQSNGMVERLHRTLKAALTCKEVTNWTDHLPLILLGLRSTFKRDLQVSPAELVFGTGLRLPGEFFVASKQTQHSEFAQNLKEAMNLVRPVPGTKHTTEKPFVHRELAECTHVFVRRGALKLSLETPYEGPFLVLKKTPKYFRVQLRRPTNISIDRLKPSFSLAEETTPTLVSKQPQNTVDLPTPNPGVNITPNTGKYQHTRSGRRVRIPDRY